MKKIRVFQKGMAFVLMLISFNASIAQPDVSGKYVAWNSDTSTVVILRLTKDSTHYTCRYDLPLAKIMNASAKNVKLNGDTLNVYFTQPISATFSTQVASNGSLQNTVWKQTGRSFPLTVKPLVRPQTPGPAVPYLADSVEYDNADKTVHLGATLTRPSSTGKKFPVAILITGSGPEDRDENIFEHRPFAVIADYLTRQGMAVLRVDDRSQGKSKGPVLKATTADFAQDVLTSLAWLKTQSYIDTTAIGMIGHSEGGMISAMAYEQWPHFAFIISLGGTGVPGATILLHQQTDPIKGLVNQSAFDAYYQLTKQTFATLHQYQDNDSLVAIHLASGFDTWKQQQPDSIATALNTKNMTGVIYASLVKPEYTNAWLKYFINTDPGPYWEKVKCPVLALNGSKDTQVDAAENTTAIVKAVSSNGNKKVTDVVFPGLNHLFQPAQSGQLAEYAIIEQTCSPQMLVAMGKWLKPIFNLKLKD